MAISVTCVCGRQLRASPELAGLVARCPVCDRVLQVPREHPARTGQTSAAPASVVAPAPRPATRTSAPVPPAATAKPRTPRTPEPVVVAQPVAAEPVEVEAIPVEVEAIPVAAVDDAVQANLLDLLAEPGNGEPAAPVQLRELPKAAKAPADAPSPAGKVAPKAKRREEPRIIASIGGMNLTPAGLVVVLLLLAGAAGGTYYFFSTVASGARIVAYQSVDRFVVLSPVTVLKGAGALNPLGTGRRGEESPATGIVALGGNDQLIVTRPNPQGKHIILRLDAQQQVIQDLGMQAQYDVVFTSGDFELRQGATVLKPTVLWHQYNPPRRFELTNSKAASFRDLLPPTIAPTTKKLKLPPETTNEAEAPSGTLTFDSSNAKGEIEFHSLRFATGNDLVRGLAAEGELHVTEPSGITVDYDYQREQVAVAVGSDHSLWHSTDQFSEEETISPYARWNMTLLFDRPGPGQWEVYIRNRRVGSIDGSLSGQSPTAFLKPPPVQGSSPQDGAVAQGATPSPRHRSNPMAIKGQPKLQGDIVDTVVIGPRNMAKGTVSMSNMQQIMLAIRNFYEAHNNRMPEGFTELVAYNPEIKAVLINPLNPNGAGYLYFKPAPDADPHTTVILHEAKGDQPDPAGLKGYLDGRVE